MTRESVEERVALLLEVGAAVAVLLAGFRGFRAVGPFADRLDRITSGCNLTVALVALAGILVLVLSPGDTIGRDGQRALRLGVAVGAVIVLGAVMNAASRAEEFTGLQAWLLYVIPSAAATVPGGIAARFALEALRA